MRQKSPTWRALSGAGEDAAADERSERGFAGRLTAMKFASLDPASVSPRRSRRLWPWLLLSPLLLIAIAATLAVQSRPLVEPIDGGLKPEEIQSTKDFLRRNDPRRLQASPHRLLRIEERQLNLMLMQLAQRYGQGRGAAQIQLQLSLIHI